MLDLILAPSDSLPLPDTRSPASLPRRRRTELGEDPWSWDDGLADRLDLVGLVLSSAYDRRFLGEGEADRFSRTRGGSGSGLKEGDETMLPSGSITSGRRAERRRILGAGVDIAG